MHYCTPFSLLILSVEDPCWVILIISIWKNLWRVFYNHEWLIRLKQRPWNPLLFFCRSLNWVYKMAAWFLGDLHRCSSWWFHTRSKRWKHQFAIRDLAWHWILCTVVLMLSVHALCLQNSKMVADISDRLGVVKTQPIQPCLIQWHRLWSIIHWTSVGRKRN